MATIGTGIVSTAPVRRPLRRALIISGQVPIPGSLIRTLEGEFDELVTWPEQSVFQGSRLPRFEFVFAMMGARRNGQESVFRVIRDINEWRLLWRRRNIPEIVVIALDRIKGEIAADIEDQGCHFRLFKPEEVLQMVSTLCVHRERLRRKGAHLQLVTIEGGRTIVLVGHNGQRPMLTTSARAIRLLLKLDSEPRPFLEPELARVMGWTEGQVRVYLQRLREWFDNARVKACIAMSPKQFIERCDKGGGWMLHAWIEKESRD